MRDEQVYLQRNDDSSNTELQQIEPLPVENSKQANLLNELYEAVLLGKQSTETAIQRHML